MTRYKMLFDRIQPEKTDDEMLTAVLSASRTEHVPTKRRTKLFVAASAAALTLGLTAAGSACGWDFNTLFAQVFSHRRDVNAFNSTPESDVDFDGMGLKLNKEFSAENCNVTIHGAIGDSKTVMLMYELTADEAAAEFARENAIDVSKVWCSLGCGVQLKPAITTADGKPLSTLSDGNVSRESTDGITIFSATENWYAEFGEIPSEGAVWHIRYDTLSISGGGNRKEIPLEQPIELDIPLDFLSPSRIELTPNSVAHINNDIVTVKRITITPLTVYWEQEFERSADDITDWTTPLIINFKDGTQAVNYTGISSSLENFIVALDSPIDVNSVMSITLGDLTVDVG